MAKIFALGIKNADLAIGRHRIVHRSKHTVEAFDGTGGFSLAGSQRRQCMKSSEKVVGAVNEKKFGHGNVRSN